MKLLNISLAITLLITSGCIFPGSDEVERTYPEAFTYDVVTLPQLQNEVPIPDSFNIEVFVTAIFECPAKIACFLPDRITVAEQPAGEAGMDIVTVKPSQFETGGRYLISVKASQREGREHRDIQMLGYSRIVK